MTEALPTSPVATEAPGDAELIAAVRDGDVAAYGVLFERHNGAAVRLARQLVPAADADDLAADGFTKVLNALQNGKGPDESFRAYLLTAVRSVHVDRIRSAGRLTVTDDEESLDRQVEFIDPAAMDFERGAAAEAFRSLPERWQLVLWHLDVEGQKPADIAPLLGMSANSVSALAYRAREGLRQAYLQSHLSHTADEACSWTTSKLGAHVRNGLSARDGAKVEAHLDDCARCTGLYLELREINSDLAAILGPALLGSAAVGYLATGTASAAGAVGLVGFARNNPGPTGVAAAAVLILAGAAGAGMVATGGDTPPPAAPASAAAPPAADAPPAAAPPADAPSADAPPAAVVPDGAAPAATDDGGPIISEPKPAPPKEPPGQTKDKTRHPNNGKRPNQVTSTCTDSGGLQLLDGALVELETGPELLDLGGLVYIGDGEKC